MSDEKNAVIVFSFPEPDDSLELGAIIVEAKKFFEGRDNIKIHLAVRNAAQQIVDMFDPEKQGESNLIEHARRELSMFSDDNEFNEAIIGAIRAFSSYKHSKEVDSFAITILTDLLKFKLLAPITDNPNEWVRHTEQDSSEILEIWQNCRNKEAFSNDGGKTYHLLSEYGSDKLFKSIYFSEPHIKVEENGS